MHRIDMFVYDTQSKKTEYSSHLVDFTEQDLEKGIKVTIGENMADKEQTPDEFKVGDVVWDVIYGKGKVTACDHLGDATYPFEVVFDNGYEFWYTEDGKFGKDVPRTLFFSEPKIEASVKRLFTPTLEGKTVVVYTADGPVVGKVFEETITHILLDTGYSFLKGILYGIYELSSTNLLTTSKI